MSFRSVQKPASLDCHAETLNVVECSARNDMQESLDYFANPQTLVDTNKQKQLENSVVRLFTPTPEDARRIALDFADKVREEVKDLETLTGGLGLGFDAANITDRLNELTVELYEDGLSEEEIEAINSNIKDIYGLCAALKGGLVEFAASQYVAQDFSPANIGRPEGLRYEEEARNSLQSALELLSEFSINPTEGTLEVLGDAGNEAAKYIAAIMVINALPEQVVDEVFLSENLSIIAKIEDPLQRATVGLALMEEFLKNKDIPDIAKSRPDLVLDKLAKAGILDAKTLNAAGLSRLPEVIKRNAGDTNGIMRNLSLAAQDKAKEVRKEILANLEGSLFKTADMDSDKGSQWKQYYEGRITNANSMRGLAASEYDYGSSYSDDDLARWRDEFERIWVEVKEKREKQWREAIKMAFQVTGVENEINDVEGASSFTELLEKQEGLSKKLAGKDSGGYSLEILFEVSRCAGSYLAGRELADNLSEDPGQRYAEEVARSEFKDKSFTDRLYDEAFYGLTKEHLAAVRERFDDQIAGLEKAAMIAEGWNNLAKFNTTVGIIMLAAVTGGAVAGTAVELGLVAKGGIGAFFIDATAFGLTDMTMSGATPWDSYPKTWGEFGVKMVHTYATFGALRGTGKALGLLRGDAKLGWEVINNAERFAAGNFTVKEMRAVATALGGNIGAADAVLTDALQILNAQATLTGASASLATVGAGQMPQGVGSWEDLLTLTIVHGRAKMSEGGRERLDGRSKLLEVHRLKPSATPLGEWVVQTVKDTAAPAAQNWMRSATRYLQWAATLPAYWFLGAGTVGAPPPPAKPVHSEYAQGARKRVLTVFKLWRTKGLPAEDLVGRLSDDDIIRINAELRSEPGSIDVAIPDLGVVNDILKPYGYELSAERSYGQTRLAIKVIDDTEPIVDIMGQTTPVKYTRASTSNDAEFGVFLEQLKKETPEVEDVLKLLKAFDPVSFNHSLMTARLAYGLAELVPANERAAFVLAALLHDVGKVAIPPEILNKPGTLTDAERSIIKKHPRKGFEIACELVIDLISKVDPQRAAELQAELDSKGPDERDYRPVFEAADEVAKTADGRTVELIVQLEIAAKILVGHHESEEPGRGYQRSGLDRRHRELLDYFERRQAERRRSDPEVARLSRVFSIIDQFEALTSADRKFYREPLSPAAAASELKKKFTLPEDATVIDTLEKLARPQPEPKQVGPTKSAGRPDKTTAFIFTNGNKIAIVLSSQGEYVFHLGGALFRDLGNGSLRIERAQVGNDAMQYTVIRDGVRSPGEYIIRNGDEIEVEIKGEKVRRRVEVREIYREDFVEKDATEAFEHNLKMIRSIEFNNVASSESVGGNAGSGHLAVNGMYDPKTGKILAFGNYLHERADLQEQAAFMLYINDDTNIIEEVHFASDSSPKARAEMQKLRGMSLIVPADWYLPQTKAGDVKRSTKPDDVDARTSSETSADASGLVYLHAGPDLATMWKSAVKGWQWFVGEPDIQEASSSIKKCARLSMRVGTDLFGRGVSAGTAIEFLGNTAAKGGPKGLEALRELRDIAFADERSVSQPVRQKAQQEYQRVARYAAKYPCLNLSERPGDVLDALYMNGNLDFSNTSTVNVTTGGTAATYRIGKMFFDDYGKAFFPVEVETNGVKRLRFYYQSGSSGNWRLLPSVRIDMRGESLYAKGVGQLGRRKEHGINAPWELQRSLDAEYANYRKKNIAGKAEISKYELPVGFPEYVFTAVPALERETPRAVALDDMGDGLLAPSNIESVDYSHAFNGYHGPFTRILVKFKGIDTAMVLNVTHGGIFMGFVEVRNARINSFGLREEQLVFEESYYASTIEYESQVVAGGRDDYTSDWGTLNYHPELKPLFAYIYDNLPPEYRVELNPDYQRKILR